MVFVKLKPPLPLKLFVARRDQFVIGSTTFVEVST